MHESLLSIHIVHISKRYKYRLLNKTSSLQSLECFYILLLHHASSRHDDTICVIGNWHTFVCIYYIYVRRKWYKSIKNVCIAYIETKPTTWFLYNKCKDYKINSSQFKWKILWLQYFMKLISILFSIYQCRLKLRFQKLMLDFGFIFIQYIVYTFNYSVIVSKTCHRIDGDSVSQ